MLNFTYLLISLIACSQATLSAKCSNSLLYIEDNGSIVSNDIFDRKSDYKSLYLNDANITSTMGCDKNNHLQERKDGFSENYKISCRNWSSSGYAGYGKKDIPYWINVKNIDDESKKELLISDIRHQANLWNLAKIEDSGENIVNFYEVGIGSTILPAPINGKKVIEVKNESLDGPYGKYFPSSLRIEINYKSGSNSMRPGRWVDTPLHELGHICFWFK